MLEQNLPENAGGVDPSGQAPSETTAGEGAPTSAPADPEIPLPDGTTARLSELVRDHQRYRSLLPEYTRDRQTLSAYGLLERGRRPQEQAPENPPVDYGYEPYTPTGEPSTEPPWTGAEGLEQGESATQARLDALEAVQEIIVFQQSGPVMPVEEVVAYRDQLERQEGTQVSLRLAQSHMMTERARADYARDEAARRVQAAQAQQQQASRAQPPVLQGSGSPPPVESATPATSFEEAVDRAVPLLQEEISRGGQV